MNLRSPLQERKVDWQDRVAHCPRHKYYTALFGVGNHISFSHNHMLCSQTSIVLKTSAATCLSLKLATCGHLALSVLFPRDCGYSGWTVRCALTALSSELAPCSFRRCSVERGFHWREGRWVSSFSGSKPWSWGPPVYAGFCSSLRSSLYNWFN